MSIPGTEAIGPVLQQAQKLIQETPANLKHFDQVLSQMEQSGQSNLMPQKPISITAENLGPDLKVAELHMEKARMAQTPEGIRKLGNEMQDGYKRLNDLVSNLQSGRSFTPQELLGIQGEMHSITLQIEVTTRVVSEAVSGIKQLMQQQV